MDRRIWLRITAVAILVLVISVVIIITRGGDSTHRQAAQLYKQAEALKKEGSLLQAQEALKTLVESFPDAPVIARAQDDLWELNVGVLFSKLKTDADIYYEVKPRDNLTRIAKKFNTTVDLIKKSNGLTGNIIRPGDRLKISQANFSILIDKSDNTLILKTDEEIVKIYSVGTGRDNCTPVGTFKIESRLVDPVWYKTGSIVPPGSPENILGTRWLGITAVGYGIHGGAKEDELGKQVSQGCVRMLNRDVEELFVIVPQGTEVVILD